MNYLVARTAPGQIEPHALALIRWLVAGFLFGLGHWGAIWAARAEILRDWKHYLVLGALGMCICGGLGLHRRAHDGGVEYCADLQHRAGADICGVGGVAQRASHLAAINRVLAL